MCKYGSVTKAITNTTNTTHTLTFLKSNYKYKRRFFRNTPNLQASEVERSLMKLTAIEDVEQARAAKVEAVYCINAKNKLNNAINQIINTYGIAYEIKLIFKLVILFVGNLLTQTNCPTSDRQRHSRNGSSKNGNVALKQISEDVIVGGGSFDDTSHQQRNYDKVSTRRCQTATLHLWQQQQQPYESLTRLRLQKKHVARNQNRHSSNSSNRRQRRHQFTDNNWQDLSPVVALLSTKATTIMQRHASSAASNGRINVLSTLAAILFMALAFNAPPLVDAGACWLSSQSNGKCSEIYLRNSTKAECCRHPELFYTDRDVTDVEFFFATTVGDGMTCSHCALSCKSMQCGWNKKCVKRKGRPKCVCAPECGAAKRLKQRSQQKIFRGHEPHSEQLRLNRHIVLGSDGISVGSAGGVVGKAGIGARSGTSSLFGEGKSPRDIRSLSSEITNVNLGVEHQMQMQMQMQHQNQRKMIIMQSQSQQKPQLSRRVEKPGRLLITANAEHDTEKPVQRRLQIFSNVRTNIRHHKSFDDDFNNDGEDDGGESAEGVGAEDREVDDNNEDADNDGDIDDWLDDVSEEASSGNHRRSSDDSTRTPPALQESRKNVNFPSRHKTNKNSNHNKKRRLHENEMELSKRQQENSNNNNFALMKRFQPAASQPPSSSRETATSNARQLENAPNHDKVLLMAADMLNGYSANNNNHKNNSNSRNNVNSGRQRERHHHHQQHQQQQQQRKRKHHQHQKQEQQENQHQLQSDHQHNHRAHMKHKKLKDHNANKNGNNVRTRTSSATSSLTAHRGDSIMPATTTTTTATTTTAVPTTMDWQTTAATATPVNAMPPSGDRRLLNHGSHIAKSSPSFSSSSSSSTTKQQKSGTSSEAFFGGGVSADVGKSSLNSDDSTLFDGIYDNFNVYGFPNRQFEVAVENFHGPHPVCGTDGRTYNTECQLKKRACRTNNPSLTVAYRGHCRTSCNGLKCLGGLTCVEDQYTIPHCIACKIDCPEDDAAAAASHTIDPKRAVCGVDGKTYRSVCDINRMICKSGRSIAVAYPGPCRADRPTCGEINCGHKHTCLVDLLTHEPRCVSCSYKCARKRRPSSLRFEDGKICGVNNHTYNSWCELRRDSCNTGFFIDIKSPRECN